MQICIEAILTTELVVCAPELIFLSDLVMFLGLRPSVVQNGALVLQNSSEIGFPMVRMTDRWEYSCTDTDRYAVRDEVDFRDKV